jgi:hypothetical protein
MNSQPRNTTSAFQGAIADGLLAPATRQRFQQLFEVAGRKSMFAWSPVPSDIADVVIVDDSVLPHSLVPETTCFVCVGDSAHRIPESSPWMVRLAPDYSVSDLMNALDRAGVFLMDWRARKASAAMKSTQPVVEVQMYRLRSWVSLSAPFNDRTSQRALALLSQKALSVDQLCLHSGMTPANAKELLRELQRQQALLVTSSSERAAAAPRRIASNVQRWRVGAKRGAA